jgi:hypothetical protein
MGAFDPFKGGGVNQQGPEIVYSPLSSAEVKNEWSYTSIPLICFYGLYRDNYNFLIYFEK